MDSSPRFSTWSAFTTQDERVSAPPPSTALNLLVSLATTDREKLQVDRTWSSSISPLHDSDFERILGSGGSAIVELRRDRWNELVAIKRSRWTSKPSTFEDSVALRSHRDQIVLELRILTFEPLASHPNIVDLTSVFLDEHADYSLLYLVLEYSPFGTLKQFVTQEENDLSVSDLIDLIYQVACGLEALHHYKICHGDVKTDNALVFQEGQILRVALSDFGHSIIGDIDNPFAAVQCVFGTRLLNAPEIRSGFAFRDPSYDITSALRTDAFSFGLLSWEILKRGRSFFDQQWLDTCLMDRCNDAMENYLNALPSNGLLSKSIEFLTKEYPDNAMKVVLVDIFRMTLQDHPLQRHSMTDVRQYLQKTIGAKTPHTLGDERLRIWNVKDSLFGKLWNGLVQAIPYDLEVISASELKLHAESETLPQLIRGHAALCVSECFTMGFGVAHDMEEAFEWLSKAARLDFPKAISWNPRIQSLADGPPPFDAHTNQEQDEAELSALPSELYLSHRIQRHMQAEISQHNDSIKPSTSIIPVNKLRFRVFNAWEHDELHPIHCAALSGDDLLVLKHLQRSDGNALSAEGFNAVHYACIGGHISTLQLLVQHNISAHLISYSGISALHLCIFFAWDAAKQAAETLLLSGAHLTARTTGDIEWDAHDILLRGGLTPLEWAVRARHRPLFQYLLPRTPNLYDSLSIAAENFFWEIVEDSLNYLLKPDTQSALPRLRSIAPIIRPFSHWIAHGRNHVVAIERTIKLCNTHGLFWTHSDQPTLLMDALALGGLDDDFALIEICLKVFSSSFVKDVKYITDPKVYPTHDSALLSAIGASGRNRDPSKTKLWETIIQTICDMYTVVELQQPVDSLLRGSFLHHAVLHHSVVGTRVLLQKGVDVNQRTFDDRGATPMHFCIHHSVSTELYILLKDFGADMWARTRDAGDYPFESRIGSDFEDFSLLAFIIHDDIEMCHHILALAIERSNVKAFRYLLSSGNAAKSVNSIDKCGATLIHKAVFEREFECLVLLLESNADASIPFAPIENGVPLLPLQIVCMMGPSADNSDMLDDERDHNRIITFDLAKELLAWHHARSDGLFRGITNLHLASYLSMMDEIQKLVADGFDPEAKGVWPGVEGEVMPKDLPDIECLQISESARQATFDVLFRIFPTRHESFPIDAEELYDSRQDISDVEGLSDVDWDDNDSLDAIMAAMDSRIDDTTQ